MTSSQIQILVAMIVYMLAVLAIGFFYAKRANKSSEEYFLGGRSFGPWVTAMSAEASDMSGWLLMGLPGLAYWCGLADAVWTAIGLAIGTYLNWLIVSKRLRRYSIRANNSITLPEFFSNRFREKNKSIMFIAALFILVFFTVYAASCFVTCGKLFSSLFGLPYESMMLLGALFVIIYTLVGGFLAESASDFMQSIVMIIALAVVVIIGTIKAGGFSAIIDNANSIPGFLDFFGLANPGVNEAGTAVVWGEAKPYSILSIFSMLAWGLGYFGMPQVLLRFMAIRKESELGASRRIAMVWVIISATISSSDSYLLIAASSVSKNIFQGIFKKNASDKQVMWVSRLTLCVIAIIAAVIALDKDSVIFKIVSFAWAGFGATFGPIMLFSLFWKRTTKAGAIAGMVGGAGMVFLWKLVISKLGGVFAIYELLPAFIFSTILIVVVSLLTKKPSAQIQADFEAVKAGKV